MNRMQFDWRWLILIALIAILANARSLPWPVMALALGGAGSWLLWQAWILWSGGRWPGSSARRVTYWRGRRIEQDGPPSRPWSGNWFAAVPATLVALLGVMLLLAALVVLLRAFNL